MDNRALTFFLRKNFHPCFEDLRAASLNGMLTPNSEQNGLKTPTALKPWKNNCGCHTRQQNHSGCPNLISTGHRLHPIEVVIDRDVMEEIVELERRVCPDPKNGHVLEVMGYLAGHIKIDQHGRLWSHVTRSFHLPELVGEPDRIVLSAEQAGKWMTEIKDAGLVYLGLWHTHNLPSFSVRCTGVGFC